MLAYLPEYEPVLDSQCPIQVHPSILASQDSVSLAPEEPSVIRAAASPHSEDDLYPLYILSSLPTHHLTRLCSIILVTPIHVHTPTAHIGTVHGDFPGEKINAHDLLVFLQSHALRRVDFHEVYNLLSQTMKAEVRTSFLLRMESSPNAMTYWTQFISEGQSDCWPIGFDLLLGHEEVWGLEGVSFGGYSIIHLA